MSVAPPSAASGERLDPRPLPAPAAAAPREQRADAEAPPAWEQLQSCAARRAYEQAERLLEAVAGRRQRAELRLRYAQWLLAGGEPDRARRTVDRALAEEPLLIAGHLLQAALATEAGDLAAGLAACRRALYLDRNCAVAHFHLGLVQQQQDEAAAQRCFRTALALAQARDPQETVEFGEGVSFGRFCETLTTLIAET
jgi:tetratricopeptide (TPR) repeat protein